LRKLNIGCGYDDWGDVRLDVSKRYYGKKTKLNIRADAQNLPFRDKIFHRTKAYHILEHLPNWRKAIKEWCRVTSKEIEIEVPIDSGLINRQIYPEIFSFPSPNSWRNLILLRKRRKEHLWKFNALTIANELKKYGFKPQVDTIKIPLILSLACGRKSKFLPLKYLKNKLTINISYRIRGISDYWRL